jgi:copper chaperone CopZ
MTCDACARGVEATLARTEGVLAASVGMTPPEARIRYDDVRTTPEALVEAIEALGYEADVAAR